MSADAKAWKGADGYWYGIHDGDCPLGDEPHSELMLSELLADVERCDGYRFAWEFRDYPDNQRGLVGYCSGGGPIEHCDQQHSQQIETSGTHTHEVKPCDCGVCRRRA